ncbi:hypothetical protein ACFS7Z_02105 [Pontibacter toksunensis]|uniref:Oligosaccharide repeat unit polymerase n=1 Tax=Pontibacter toksunensis TaxID=1332631 RepID=A0ABW6BQE3_9BACT
MLAADNNNNNNIWIFLFILLLIAAFLTVNPIATVACISVIPFFLLLWRKPEPPILFVGLLYQWVAVSIKLLYSDIYDLDFDNFHVFAEDIYTAYALSLLGLVVLTVSIITVLHKPKALSEADEKNFVSYNITRLVLIYISFSTFVTLLGSSFLSFGGLAQVTYAFTLLKWSFFILLFITIAKSESKKNYLILISIIILEVLIGFAAYFSSFKEILFFSFIGAATVIRKIKLSKLIPLAFLGYIVFSLGVLWTAIKSDYRMFLSGGERQQIVTVSREDALDYFFKLASEVPDETIAKARFELVNRISYIDFFSGAIAYVPERLPHENGKVWFSAITHVFKPRIFFPDKEAIDDSKHLNKYTGLSVATGEMGASFSLGYMADSYIDFGPVFMFIPLALMGLLIGGIYRYFLKNAYNVTWGYALIAPLFYFVGTYEIASIKLVGNLIMYFMVFYLLNKFIVPKLDLYLKKN